MNRMKYPRPRGLRYLFLLAFCVAFGGHMVADEVKKPADESPAVDEKVPAEKPADEALKADEAKPEAKPDATEAAPQKVEKVVALVGGRVVTMSSAGVLDGATVLITGDKISAIGKDVQIPDNATRIDVTGMTVAPGLIDSRSSLWLATDSISAAASDGSLKAIDAVDPFSDSWIEVSRQGVTAVSVQASGSLGGQSVVLRVAPATSVAELVIKENAAMQASLGLSGSAGNSQERYLQYEALKKILTSAKTYKEEWDKYEEAVKKVAETPKAGDKPAAEKPATDKPAADDKKTETPSADSQRPSMGERTPGGSGRGDFRRPGGGRSGFGRPPGVGGPPGEGGPPSGAEPPKDGEAKPATAATEEKKPELPKKPKSDPLKDVLVKVLKKELPLRIEVHRADDIANALQLAKDFELTFVFEGVSQAGRSWTTLAEQHPPLIAGPFADFESTPSYASSKDDRYEKLKEVEGLIAVATFSKDPRGSRLLRFHAAEAVAAGLTAEQAMRAITIDAARVLGIDAETGSLQDGKHADVIVVAGDPLNPAAPVMMTMSHGEVVYQAADVKAVEHSGLVDVPTMPSTLPTDFALVSQQVLHPDGKLAPAVIQIKAGRIVSVNAATTETGGLPVIDLGSAVISPGLIVGHFSEVDVETTDAVASQIRAIDSFSPDSSALRKLSHAGFTTVLFAPDSRSVVAGQVGCVRYLSKDQILHADGQPVLPASKFVMAARARNFDRYPASLSGQLELLSQYFAGSPVSSNLYIPDSVRSLLAAEHERVLATLKNKSTVAVIEAASSPEIEAAVALIRKFELKAMVLHPEDPQTSIDALQQLQTGLIVRPTRTTDHDWYAQDIAAASNKGIRIAVSGSEATKLRQTLAVLTNAGMSPEAALRSVTSDAADCFGLTNIGKLAENSAADIVIWNGSPLNPSARPIHVIVDGRLTKDAQ